MRFNLTIDPDDPALKPLYEHLAVLPQGPGKQHRARAIQQVLYAGAAALYGRGVAQPPTPAIHPATQQVVAPAPQDPEHVDAFIDNLDFANLT
ncbi:conserved hypothetical protein [Thiomonas sp. X19]|uniref:hypothetical protein n=1 Tax=Thiomonas sp. X19 TaxID=1050370 RepID=UPI000B6E0CA7|nr:hypothetical protein [Thiomonas sp. X19]SCC94028.1 conserved hypothetical protein [Thiomonas sp. X19]